MVYNRYNDGALRILQNTSQYVLIATSNSQRRWRIKILIMMI